MGPLPCLQVTPRPWYGVHMASLMHGISLDRNPLTVFVLLVEIHIVSRSALFTNANLSLDLARTLSCGLRHWKVSHKGVEAATLCRDHCPLFCLQLSINCFKILVVGSTGTCSSLEVVSGTTSKSTGLPFVMSKSGINQSINQSNFYSHQYPRRSQAQWHNSQFGVQMRSR